MKISLQVLLATTVCAVLAGCQGTESDADNEQTNASEITPHSVANGFYRSGVFVTDGSGVIVRDASIRLSEEDRRLVSFDTSDTLRTNGTSNANQQRALPPVWSDYRVLDYDENGNFIGIEISIESISDESTMSRNMEYDIDGKLIAATEIDTRGRQWKETYSYNAQGQLSVRGRNLADEDVVGALYVRNFEYDDAGKLVRQTQNATSVPTPADVIDFFYDTDSRLTELTFDLEGDGTVDGRHTYSYDGDGNVAQIIKYGSDGAVFRQLDYSYTKTDELVFNETLFELRYEPY